MATIKFKDTLQNCLKDSEFKAEFESLKPNFKSNPLSSQRD